MTERERLTKLISEAEDKYPTIPLVNGCKPEFKYFLADYLLANRVKAPPCEVGDTVYIIDNRDMLDIDPSVCSVVDDEIYEMGYGRTQSGELKWLFLVCDTGEDFYNDDIGKTVFLSRELAQEALEAKQNDKE